MENDYILSAAIYFEDDETYPHQPRNIMNGFVITGRRHHNIFVTLKILNIDRFKLPNSIQGFITSDDRFLNREEAAIFAYEKGQISKPKDKLYSEDLY